jgi:hypothetical protein
VMHQSIYRYHCGHLIMKDFSHWENAKWLEIKTLPRS